MQLWGGGGRSLLGLFRLHAFTDFCSGRGDGDEELEIARLRRIFEYCKTRSTKRHTYVSEVHKFPYLVDEFCSTADVREKYAVAGLLKCMTLFVPTLYDSFFVLLWCKID